MENSILVKLPPALAVGNESDRLLVARIRAGETVAFERIVAMYQKQVTRVVRRLLTNEADVDDVVQEVFLTVLEKTDKFHGQAKLSTWIIKIAINKCRWHGRKNVLRLRHLKILAQLDWGDDRSGRLAEQEDHDQIRQAVKRLPYKYREPIVLHYFEQMSPREVSQALGISLNAVHIRLSRARNKLKKPLAKFLESP